MCVELALQLVLALAVPGCPVNGPHDGAKYSTVAHMAAKSTITRELSSAFRVYVPPNAQGCDCCRDHLTTATAAEVERAAAAVVNTAQRCAAHKP